MCHLWLEMLVLALTPTVARYLQVCLISQNDGHQKQTNTAPNTNRKLFCLVFLPGTAAVTIFDTCHQTEQIGFCTSPKRSSSKSLKLHFYLCDSGLH